MSSVIRWFAAYRDDEDNKSAHATRFITRSAQDAHRLWFTQDFFTAPTVPTSAPPGETPRARRARFRNRDTFEREKERQRRDAARVKRAEQEVRRRFIATTPMNSVAGYGRVGWRGVRVLGQGGQGIVGLWEWRGLTGPPVGPRQIVVKKQEFGIAHEKNMMLKLNFQGNHAVRLIYPRSATDDPQSPDDQRLIIEFCSGGDLQTLLENHRKTEINLSEEELWRLFYCFAKGLSIMNHGTEQPTRTLQDRQRAICHFDLKPMNIFLEQGNDPEHTYLPICKIGDFGLARTVPVAQDQRILSAFRKVGTSGWYTPEQFTRRWQYPNRHHSFAGDYATHSNIWGIGAIMYQLATLGGPPKPKEIRITDSEGALDGKYTFLSYGDKLYRDDNYSSHLKMLIWRCLAENPVDRPSLEDLHGEIEDALAHYQDQMDNRGREALAFNEPQAEADIQSPAARAAPEAPASAEAFRFHIYLAEYLHRNSLTSQRRTRNAWFQADRNMTIGDLRHAICHDWIPEWRQDGMQAQHLFLRVSTDRQDDRVAVDDEMTLWAWGVRNLSVLHIDQLPGDFFIGAR